ncbi:MAG: hypothetical protein F6K24_37005, partial [Okeania sp. SIO2D1]|nr:hypothetical protein [Okeania sp. SIO2D1]
NLNSIQPEIAPKKIIKIIFTFQRKFIRQAHIAINNVCQLISVYLDNVRKADAIKAKESGGKEEGRRKKEEGRNKSQDNFSIYKENYF